MLCVIELVQTYGSEWSVGYLWRWTNLSERIVLVVLALMLIRVLVIVVRFSHHCRLARFSKPIDADNSARNRLAAELNLKLDGLKSISATAPYLGLAGTCLGILSIFYGFAMERGAVEAMLVSEIAAAFISTAAGIVVAVPATYSYNYLRTRTDSLQSEVSDGPLVRRRFPLRPRFSTFSFAVIAAPALAISVAEFMTFSSTQMPKGLPVRLLKIGARETEPFSVGQLSSQS
jgi:hypothetical protein